MHDIHKNTCLRVYIISMNHNFQLQILIGTVFGGSSLIKPPKGINYCVSMRSNNKKWLEYKMLEMSDFFDNFNLKKYGNTYRCSSSCHPKITELHDKIYQNGKRNVTMNVLDTLTDTGLATWFLDGGSKTGRGKKNAYINTTKFGEEGTQIILKYFQEVGMDCTINHDKNRLKILFSVDGTEVFLKTIAHRFPTFMYHRI